jgi:NAD(P)H-nitrite reductase large subunit
MGVDRCVCMDVYFHELLELHRNEGLGMDELIRRTGCCTGCTTCEPYVRLTLQSGEVVHPVLSPSEVSSIMAGT